MNKEPDSSDDGDCREERKRRRAERWDFFSWRFIGVLFAVDALGIGVILRILGV